MLAENINMNRIGFFITDFRRKKNWTQSEFAKKLGVSQLKYPIKTCRKLAKFLDGTEKQKMREALVNQLLDELDN